MAVPTAIAALVSGPATYTNKPSSTTDQGGAERTGGVQVRFEFRRCAHTQTELKQRISPKVPVAYPRGSRDAISSATT
jgi:hypothetical protein